MTATVIDIPEDFLTIQEGIDNSTDGDTVLVQPGTYFENINFNGHNITLGSMFIMTGDTSYISQTVIDGNQNGSVVTFESGEDSTTVLSGFTITNGLSYYGGGILCDTYSSPLLSQLTILSNQAYLGGGGICCKNNSSVSMLNTTINNNYLWCDQWDEGGAGVLCTEYSLIDLTNCTINENGFSMANCGWSISGGGISCTDGSTIIAHRCLISNNFSMQSATARIHDSSAVEFINCTIVQNLSTWNGPSIDVTDFYGDSSSAIIFNSIVWDDSDVQISVGSPFSYNELIIEYTNLKNGLESIEGSGEIYFDSIINSDSLFENPESGNYTLFPESPCIDAGDPDSQLDPDCSRADMGAYPFNHCEGINSGDVIADDNFDVLDIVAMVGCIIETQEGEYPCLCHDTNDDCIVDILDVVILVSWVIGN